jgi:integrase
VGNVLQFDIPVYKNNKAGSYIEFRAFDPILGMMRRKIIKLNKIKPLCLRRQYAKEVIARITDKLHHGWSPWLLQNTQDLFTFEEALSRYEAHNESMFQRGYHRKETYAGYKSNIKIMRHYIEKHRPIYYVYQFDRKFCVDFLDYVFIERDNGAQTRNNYLNFLRVFSAFLVEKGYLESKPTDGIAPISKRLFQKQRTVIPSEVIKEITEYCRKHDPYFLLVCYLLFYCFIRPVELTRLRVKNFNLRESTITIPEDCSKNRKKQTVTIPKNVLLYALDLGIFSAPENDFIFSERLKPGDVEITPKQFRDHWAGIRKALNLKAEWKFYSLKDTGITEMLRNNMAAIDVRDQARHSSLLITEIYTDHCSRPIKEIIDLDGSL